MKKLIVILSSFILGSTLLGACGEEEFKPKEVCQFNTLYKTTSEEEQDGKNPVIDVSGVIKKNDNLVIKIGAPTMKQIQYAFDNYLTIKPINSKGENVKFDTYKLKYIGGEVEAELYITGLDLNEIKWIEIGPYKTKGGNPVIFEVK